MLPAPRVRQALYDGALVSRGMTDRFTVKRMNGSEMDTLRAGSVTAGVVVIAYHEMQRVKQRRNRQQQRRRHAKSPAGYDGDSWHVSIRYSFSGEDFRESPPPTPPQSALGRPHRLRRRGCGKIQVFSTIPNVPYLC